MLQIRSRGGLQYSNYPRTILNKHSNTKHNKGFIILQRVWILQSLNTTWFNNLPIFDEDKSLMLVLYLIESEAVPARYSFKQNIELLIFGQYRYTVIEFRAKYQKILLIQTVLTTKKNKNLNTTYKSPPICLHKQTKEEIKQEIIFLITSKLKQQQQKRRQIEKLI